MPDKPAGVRGAEHGFSTLDSRSGDVAESSPRIRRITTCNRWYSGGFHGEAYEFELAATTGAQNRLGRQLDRGLRSCAKDRSEADLGEYVRVLKDSGRIDPGSIVTPRIFGPHEAMAAADQLAAAQVDLVVVANIAFPNGQVFLTLATHPALAQTPLAVIAEPEPQGPEWGTNSWCGVIMNNHVARQLGRPIVTIPGPFNGEAFQAKFARLLRVAATIHCLRRDLLCRFGDAPGGFHSATGDQIAFARVFGTRVDTVDLTAVMEAYRTCKARGYLGEAAFCDDDVHRTVSQVTDGRQVQADAAMIEPRCAAVPCVSGHPTRQWIYFGRAKVLAGAQ